MQSFPMTLHQHGQARLVFFFRCKEPFSTIYQQYDIGQIYAVSLDITMRDSMSCWACSSLGHVTAERVTGED